MIKKEAYIFLNGEINIEDKFYKELFLEQRDIYCADGGIKFCETLNIVPKEIWGDLDSSDEKIIKKYKEKGSEIKKFPVDKDFTDGELLIDYVISKGYSKVYLLGALGGRIDHELTNINLLSKYEELTILTEKEVVFFIGRKYTINNRKFSTVSFIPMSDKVKGLTLEGFKYPLNNYNLLRGESRCMSNILISDKGEISYDEGQLLCIINLM